MLCGQIHFPSQRSRTPNKNLDLSYLIKLFLHHLHVYFCAKFHFLLGKCRRPPGLVYSLGGPEGIPKNVCITDAKSHEPVILSFRQQKGPWLSSNVQKEYVAQNVRDPVSWHIHSVGKILSF